MTRILIWICIIIAMCSFSGCNRHSNQIAASEDEIKIESDFGEESILVRKSLAVPKEINIELIIEYGKRIHVDLVLIIYANGADYYCEIDSYLVDTNSKKVFHSNEHDIKNESYYPILAQGTTEVIEQFLQNR